MFGSVQSLNADQFRQRFWQVWESPRFGKNWLESPLLCANGANPLDKFDSACALQRVWANHLVSFESPYAVPPNSLLTNFVVIHCTAFYIGSFNKVLFWKESSKMYTLQSYVINSFVNLFEAIMPSTVIHSFFAHFKLIWLHNTTF